MGTTRRRGKRSKKAAAAKARESAKKSYVQHLIDSNRESPDFLPANEVDSDWDAEDIYGSGSGSDLSGVGVLTDETEYVHATLGDVDEVAKEEEDEDEGETRDDGAAAVIAEEQSVEGVQQNVERGSICAGMPSDMKLVDAATLIQQVESMGRHVQDCTGGCFVYKDTKKPLVDGLGTTWTFSCVSCGQERRIFSHGADRESHKTNTARSNDKLVWGAMATGIGYAQLEELLGLVDVAMMSKKKYRKHEARIGEVWEEHLLETLRRNGEEEWRLADAAGQIVLDEHGNDTGFRYTDICGDGGWGMRSYGGHGMTSSSGVAIAIGRLSKKPLFVGVRNKFCSACARAKQAGTESPAHRCFKNFSGPSTQMESEIILEAFCESERTHKLQYWSYIGDGDSNTFKAIQTGCPYGHRVQKIDCANHIVVRFSDHLHKLVEKTSIACAARNELRAEEVVRAPVVAGTDADGPRPAAEDPPQPQKITRADRLVKGVRTAIQNAAATGDVAALRKDIANAPFHVFGQHDKCGDFCTRKDSGEKNLVPTLQQAGLMSDIMIYVNKMVNKAESLIEDETTNVAERYMSLVAKFIGAKRVPYWKGGGYTYRCHGAAIAHSQGPGWSVSPLRKHLQASPGHRIKRLSERRERHRKRKLELESGKKAAGGGKRRRRGAGRADHNYGPEAHLTLEELLEKYPDMEEDKVQSEKQKLFQKLVQDVDTEEKRSALEEKTRAQHASSYYRMERVRRLPSSKFGTVAKRRANTSCHNLVKELLHPAGTPVVTPAISYGLDNEETAVQKYISEHGVDPASVRRCGLVVSEKWPHLATSPDRVLGDDGLIEVKCIFPPTLKGHRTFLDAVSVKPRPKKGGGGVVRGAAGEVPPEAVGEAGGGSDEGRKPDICLELKSGCLQLKRNHSYYYQIQGQLNICDKNYCILLVYSDSDFHVEKIFRDISFWEKDMEPKLTKYFMDCVLHEQVLKRANRGLPIYDPPWITEVAGYKRANWRK